MKRHSTTRSGFTLIEMLVSIALFAIVMVVCVGALLSLVGANKKAEALESAMNNLNISLDDMVRNAREGTGFNGNFTINGNGNLINGGSLPLICNLNNVSFSLVFRVGSYGWKVE